VSLRRRRDPTGVTAVPLAGRPRTTVDVVRLAGRPSSRRRRCSPSLKRPSSEQPTKCGSSQSSRRRHRRTGALRRGCFRDAGQSGGRAVGRSMTSRHRRRRRATTTRSRKSICSRRAGGNASTVRSRSGARGAAERRLGAGRSKRLSARPEVHERRRANEHPPRVADRATVPNVSDDTDKPFPRLARKPRPVMAAQRLKRRARDEFDRRVGEAAGAVTPGVQDRTSRRRPRDDTFGARLRGRLRPSAGSSTWRV
jgi:hypothetical protein